MTTKLLAPALLTASLLLNACPAPPGPTLSVSNVSVAEGTGGMTVVEVEVALSAPSAKQVTVAFATRDGTAQSGADYSGAAGTLTFEPGETSKQVSVAVAPDALNEDDEQLFVDLSDATNAGLTRSTATVTIANDDAPPSILVTDVSVSEGDQGPTPVSVTLALSAPSGRPVSVAYATADGTAVAGQDYVGAVGTATFEPGATTAAIALQVNGDVTWELDEAFAVGLSGPVNALLPAPAVAVRILNDDGALPAVHADDVAATEGTGAARTLTFNVTLNGAPQQQVRVRYALRSGTALSYGDPAAGEADFTGSSGLLTFAPGTVSVPVTVPIAPDALDEDDETFFLDLTGVEGAVIARATATGTIVDDDATPDISIPDLVHTEGATGTEPITTPITLSAPSGKAITVHYSTSDGTARATGANADYMSITDFTTTIYPGETETRIPLWINGDLLNEGDETFLVTLSSPVNGNLAKAVGTITIRDDDPVPVISIADCSTNEGNPGSNYATTARVTLSGPSDHTVQVTVSTADGTATAGSDYLPRVTVLSFPPGTTTQYFYAEPIGDTTAEGKETFQLALSAPAYATLGRSTATVTVYDDDPPDARPMVILIGGSAIEYGTLQFIVGLTADSTVPVTVDYMTRDGTAIAGKDYVATQGTLTFAPGVRSQFVTVPLINDAIREQDFEEMELVLTSATNATLGRDADTGTIQDDEPLPEIRIGNASVVEGDSGTRPLTFNVTLSAASDEVVSFAFATGTGLAVSPDWEPAFADFDDLSGVVTFAPGETSKTISITVHGDTTYEPFDYFLLELSDPVHATLQRTEVRGTIVNDDPVPTVDIQDVTVTEGTAGRKAATFLLTLSSQSFGSGVTVLPYDGTAIGADPATAGADYDKFPDYFQVDFPEGVTRRLVHVFVRGDEAQESNETFTLRVFGTGYVNRGRDGVATIVDDDP